MVNIKKLRYFRVFSGLPIYLCTYNSLRSVLRMSGVCKCSMFFTSIDMRIELLIHDCCLLLRIPIWENEDCVRRVVSVVDSW